VNSGNKILRPRLYDEECLNGDGDSEKNQDATGGNNEGTAPPSLTPGTVCSGVRNIEAYAASLI